MSTEPARPLRVLQVCARFLPEMGGIETHVEEVSRRLSRRDDLEITVLTTDRSRRLPAKERADGYDVLRVPAWPRRRDYYLAPAISKVIREGSWDLVHCQGVHTPVPILAMLAARRAAIPYLLTFHTGGHSIAYRNRVRSLQWRLLGPLLRGADSLVAVSRSEARTFVSESGIDPSAIQVIHNGGSLPEPPAGVEVVPGRIVSSGRLERYKGHHRVIEALPFLLKVRPEVTLDILGAGPYEPELRALAAELGVEQAVTIRHLPPKDRLAMASALRQAEVVAAFSEYEAHPVAVMEALTLRLPVVGYDVAGIGDLVQDGLVSGLSPQATAEQAAQALLEAMAAGAGEQRALPTWETCAEALGAVYRRVGSGRRPAVPGIEVR